MAEEPADDQWRSFRISKWTPELAAQTAAGERPPVPTPPLVKLEAESYNARRAGVGAGWELIPGLGHTGPGSMAIFPTTVPSYKQDRLATDAPRLDYDVTLDKPGQYRVDVALLPTHALSGGELRFAVGLDGGDPQIVSMAVKDGGTEWAQGVLNAKRIASTTLTIDKPGKRVLNIYAVDAGVVLDRISITPN